MTEQMINGRPYLLRKKRVAKEYSDLLLSEGYGNLFGPNYNIGNAKKNLRKTRLIQQAIEFGMWVPKAHINFVNPPVDVNPRVPPSDPNELPF